MIVLSLFDGCSCAQVALERAGIKVEKYYASEIKKDAVKATQYNYPNTVQLGDVTEINFNKLNDIDILIGGSPCQDFSRGNSERKGLDGCKSSLFYYYIDALKICKPKYFLLENVVMEPEWNVLISDKLGVYPVRINSKLVSAQLRDRFYWTNIPGGEFDIFGNSNIGQPEDKKIKLQDILTSGYADREKARCLLESDSRRLTTIKKMLHRYYNTGFTTLVFEKKNDKNSCRYLNQTELERCQNIPSGYTSILNRDKAASLLGDGFTVDVIAHILKHIKNN